MQTDAKVSVRKCCQGFAQNQSHNINLQQFLLELIEAEQGEIEVQVKFPFTDL